MNDSQHIDWKSVHEQLQSASQSLNHVFEPSPETVQRTLEQRAAKAAAIPFNRDPNAETQTVLIIEAEHLVAGIAMEWVAEVIPLPQGYAFIPEADDRLLGLINVHNQLVNLVSPWPLLQEQPPSSATHYPYAVLLRHPQLKIAIGCTRAVRLLTLHEEAWQSDRMFLYEDNSPPGLLMDIPALFKSWERKEESPQAA